MKFTILNFAATHIFSSRYPMKHINIDNNGNLPQPMEIILVQYKNTPAKASELEGHKSQCSMYGKHDLTSCANKPLTF